MTGHYSQDEPLYSRPDEPLDEKTLGTLLRRARRFGSSSRKQAQYRKYLVWKEKTRPLVLSAIFDRQNDADVRERMAKFITSVRNDAKDIAREVAVVWKHGAIRTLVGRSSAKVRKAIADLERETMLDVVAPDINQLGFLQGPQIVVPVVRGGALHFDALPSHIYDVVHSEDDPCGDPVAVAWSEAYSTDGTSVRTMVLDPMSLRQYTFEGDRPVEDTNARVDHEGGFCPAAVFRTRVPLLGDDWHDVDLNDRLIEGTVDVLVVLTALSFVRKSQCKKLLTLIGDTSSIPRGAVMDSERPMLAKTQAAAKLSVEAVDFDTPPDGFLRHALFLAHCMAEPFGGRIEAPTGQPAEFAKVVIPYEAQTELRNGQILHAKRFEQELWAAAVVMMGAMGHRHASVLPGPDEMRARIHVEYGSLSRTIADPSKESERQSWDLKHGLSSEFELMRRRLGPGSTHDDARKRTMANLEDRAVFHKAVVARDLNMDGNGVQTTPQMLGAMGTPARESNRAMQPDDEEGSSRQQAEPLTE